MSGDDGTRVLREAIEEFGSERASELIAEAGAEAMAKARARLVDAMTKSLLAHSAMALRGESPPARGGAAQTRSGTNARRRSVKRRKPKPSTDQHDSVNASRSRAGPSRDDPELAYYVYGVVAAGVELPADLAGVDPHHAAFLLEDGDLAAIVSRVALDQFGEERLRDNLNDVNWLEDKARAHENALDAALQATTVVPMRLCTIYSSQDQVRSMLAEERALFADALKRLKGKAEWGAKVIAAPRALARVAAERADADPEQGQASRGAAYMARKKEEAMARDREDEIAEEWALAIHERLAGAASEALLNPLQRPEVSGHEGDMILNGVYLVDDELARELQERVEGLQREFGELEVWVELTGPWPPYNFVKSSIEAAR
jgi:hypothetical protein